jgi:hypothetical protein
MTQTELIRDLQELLSPHGFKNKKLLWHRRFENLHQIVEFQKGYSVSYYVNLIVQVQSISKDPNDSHLTVRLSQLSEDAPEAVRLWDQGSWPQDLAATKVALIRTGLPFLNQFSSSAELCRRVVRRDVGPAYVMPELLEYCRSQSADS